MTNPYQRGSGVPFIPDGLQWGQRRTPYASVASGAGAYIHRPSGFSHLLNPASPAEGLDSAAMAYPPSRSSSELPGDSARNGPGTQNGTLGPAGRYGMFRQPPLPSHSRAFEPFFRPSLHDFGIHSHLLPHSNQQRFFIPSYMKGSTYAHKLEDAHGAKLAAAREGAAALGSASAQSSSAAVAIQSQAGSGGAAGGAGNGHSGGSSNGLHGGSRMSLHDHHLLLGGMGVSKLSAGAGLVGSHRGLAFDVVEKPPSGQDEDEDITPLPSRWNPNDKCNGLEVVSDGLEVKCSTPRGSSDRGERDHEAFAVRADHHMPPECGIYYFEVTILSARSNSDIMVSVGFSAKHVALSRAPGWEPDSWGYHSDDGHSFTSNTPNGNGKSYGPPYNVGDVIGCGINFRTSCAFFTKNGQFLGNAFRDVKGLLYPSVGLKRPGSHVRVNFGQTPFQFGIDAMVEREREAILKEIETTNTASLAPPLDETDLIQKLVLQFLQHDGYIETARAFASEMKTQKQALCLNPDEVVEGSNITDDEDANNRQRIRRAILEGDIDRALKYTNAYYPQVLKDNEHVNFRLRCRKFIEMIRRDAELSMVGGDKRASSNGVGSLHPQHHGHDMDVDQSSLAASSSWERMDTEDHNPYYQREGSDGGRGDDDGVETDLAPGPREMEAILYGQALQAEFRDDPRREVKKTLEDIFALMAYTNPLKEKEVAHLLDRKGRVAVAEELNSAILLSLGKSERSALEILWAQTSVLLDDIRHDGGPGAFVSIQDLVAGIPSGQYSQ